MKSLNLVFVMLFFVNIMQAQNSDKEENSALIFGGFGYGVINNDNGSNYNLDYVYNELSYQSKINENFGIASGLSYIQLSGTGFNVTGNFYQERDILQIPLAFTYNKEVFDNVHLYGSLGVYGQTIVKDEYQYAFQTQKDIFDGWNFGVNFKAGILFDLFKNIEGGFVFSSQNDFSKFNSDTLNNGQKMSLNSVGLVARLKF